MNPEIAIDTITPTLYVRYSYALDDVCALDTPAISFPTTTTDGSLQSAAQYEALYGPDVILSIGCFRSGSEITGFHIRIGALGSPCNTVQVNALVYSVLMGVGKVVRVGVIIGLYVEVEFCFGDGPRAEHVTCVMCAAQDLTPELQIPKGWNDMDSLDGSSHLADYYAPMMPIDHPDIIRYYEAVRRIRCDI